MIIETDNLTKYYGKARGIIEVNLAVREGEVFGFLGPNGAGKSTLINLLLSLLNPTDGTARVFGMDVQEQPLEIHQRLGNLPSELGLYPRLTGRQFLKYMASLRGGVEWQHVEELAERLGFNMDRRIKEYSSGNKHKVGLIQAFMHRPELLMLDEPTIGLDPLVQQQFYQMVHEARNAGRTIFLSSHNLREVDHLCDRVGIIREGRLVAVEEVDALKEDARNRVEIKFKGEPPVERFRDFEGVADFQTGDHRIAFSLDGPPDPILEAAHDYDVVHVISEPDLDQIFLQYYREEDETKEETPKNV